LLKNRRGNTIWCTNPPEDIADFKRSISDLFGKDCWIKYNGTDNAVIFCIHDMDKENMLEKVSKFLSNNDTPFEEIKFFNSVGKIL